MRTLSLLFAALFLLHTAALAQKAKTATSNQQSGTRKETVVLSRAGSGRTIIEISGDGVFVDGERVASHSDLDNNQVSKKIIINSGDGKWDNAPSVFFDENTGERPILGVYTDGKYKGSGAYIESVNPGSAAEDAGLRQGDIITKIDSSYIGSASDLVRTIRDYAPGDRITIQYRRNEREEKAIAMLQAAKGMELLPRNQYSFSYPDLDRPDRMMPPFGSPWQESRDNKIRLGVTVEDLEDGGVSVMSVRDNSIASSGGLRKDDVITAINDTPVRNTDDLQRYVQDLRPGNKLKLDLLRNGERISKTVSIPGPRNIKDL